MKNHNTRERGILSTQYFLYFGVLGIHLPYFNPYCYYLGFDGMQIGIISGVRSMAVVCMPLLWGILADRTQKRKYLFVLCNFVSAGLFALYFVTDSFLPMLAVTLIFSIFYAPVIAFMEAFAMEILGPDKNRYGHVRVWGTLAFVIMALTMGKIVDIYGVQIILVLIFAGSVVQALVSLKMPKSPLRPKTPARLKAAYFFNKKMIVFQTSAFLMLVSHGAYYGFFSIHLKNLEYSSMFIGAAWALASIAEIGVMLKSDKILSRFTPRKILFFSLCVAVLRWIITAFVVSPAALFGVQILHAATYGTFHIASILYMEHLVPSQARTAGQAINNSVTYGLGMMAGFLASGYIFEQMGAQAAFLASAAVAALGAIVFMAFWDKNKKTDCSTGC